MPGQTVINIAVQEQHYFLERVKGLRLEEGRKSLPFDAAVPNHKLQHQILLIGLKERCIIEVDKIQVMAFSSFIVLLCNKLEDVLDIQEWE